VKTAIAIGSLAAEAVRQVMAGVVEGMDEIARSRSPKPRAVDRKTRSKPVPRSAHAA
jgi:hypothetical protein